MIRNSLLLQFCCQHLTQIYHWSSIPLLTASCSQIDFHLQNACRGTLRIGFNQFFKINLDNFGRLWVADKWTPCQGSPMLYELQDAIHPVATHWINCKFWRCKVALHIGRQLEKAEVDFVGFGTDAWVTTAGAVFYLPIEKCQERKVVVSEM